MDPLFERRELSKKVHIHSKYLQRNIQPSLLAQLRILYEGKCSGEGYIQPNSITIIDYSLGRTNYVKGGIDYDIKFQADICFPHIGQVFRGKIGLRSKIGIHIETPPIKVLIPRDTHMGQPLFDKLEVGEEAEFEVIGSQFKQNDDTIIIVGKLVGSKDTPPSATLVEAPQIPAAAATSADKRVVFAPSTATAEPRKTRKLKRSEPDNRIDGIDNAFAEGKDEGESG
jgi:DNA-directed RNA polymerase subunit E'/Rpb7